MRGEWRTAAMGVLYFARQGKIKPKWWVAVLLLQLAWRIPLAVIYTILFALSDATEWCGEKVNDITWYSMREKSKEARHDA